MPIGKCFQTDGKLTQIAEYLQTQHIVNSGIEVSLANRIVHRNTLIFIMTIILFVTTYWSDKSPAANGLCAGEIKILAFVRVGREKIPHQYKANDHTSYSFT